MRQSSGKVEGLGRHGVASPAMAFVTVDGTAKVSSCGTSVMAAAAVAVAAVAAAAAASAASCPALLARRISCLRIHR